MLIGVAAAVSRGSRYLRRSFYLAIIIAVVCALAAIGAHARPRISFGIQDHGNSPFGVITINDEAAAVFRRPAGGLSPLDRARVCAQRLDSLISEQTSPNQIWASAIT